uniref:Uncharacterized protein n=1 Tax=Chromera velia CCMP2878 TaxID=1169474 RepID=A0A0G4H5V1_9ALVE|eukprot:Cvel_24801.t1-p1 / transcript=Cvel_24801.t1 / gene=Cvel_24801 / organism=Chromera_velia_CCMP2878 / gene_product=hypothetical protein / transcript_product=hypothetical protein / location=Cvel_scaffold2731:12715-18157(-) / protein_length=443 / sequence_SO=supercontig / SO=protein_coding / is_pseudo=false
MSDAGAEEDKKGCNACPCCSGCNKCCCFASIAVAVIGLGIVWLIAYAVLFFMEGDNTEKANQWMQENLKWPEWMWPLCMWGDDGNGNEQWVGFFCGFMRRFDRYVLAPADSLVLIVMVVVIWYFRQKIYYFLTGDEQIRMDCQDCLSLFCCCGAFNGYCEKNHPKAIFGLSKVAIRKKYDVKDKNNHMEYQQKILELEKERIDACECEKLKKDTKNTAHHKNQPAVQDDHAPTEVGNGHANADAMRRASIMSAHFEYIPDTGHPPPSTPLALSQANDRLSLSRATSYLSAPCPPAYTYLHTQEVQPYPLQSFPQQHRLSTEDPHDLYREPPQRIYTDPSRTASPLLPVSQPHQFSYPQLPRATGIENTYGAYPGGQRGGWGSTPTAPSRWGGHEYAPFLQSAAHLEAAGVGLSAPPPPPRPSSISSGSRGGASGSAWGVWGGI